MVKRKSYNPYNGIGSFDFGGYGSSKGQSIGSFDFGGTYSGKSKRGSQEVGLGLWDTRPAKVRYAEKVKVLKARIEEKSYASKLRELERQEREDKARERAETFNKIKSGFNKVSKFFKRR